MGSVSRPRLALASVAVAGACFVLGAVVYVGLRAILPDGAVFGALYRMFLYHRAFPYAYIAVVAVTWGVVFALGAPFVARLEGWRRRAAILAGMLGTVVLASIPGGILWVVHDMQAGWFPEGGVLWSRLTWGATTGLVTGWLVVALSVPYNILGLGIGYAVTEAALRFVEPRRSR